MIEYFTNLDKVTQIATIISIFVSMLATLLVNPIRRYIKLFFSFFLSPFLFFNKLEKQIQELQKELKNTAEYIKLSVERMEETNHFIINRIFIMLHEEPVAIFESDKEGQYTWVNNTYMKMAGKPFTDLNGNGWLNSVPPKIRDQVRQEWHSSVKEDRSFEMSYNITGAQGEIIPVQAKTYPMVDKNGEVIGHMGFVRKLSGILTELVN